MKVATVRSSRLREAERSRLDARYHTAPAVRIREVLAKRGDVELRSLGGPNGLGMVSMPSRFRRVYAAPGEEYIAYLRPYDVFEFLPPEADRLSVTRTTRLSEYQIKEGELLLSVSGRNLGPLTIADSYLARFALSHDMARVTIPDEVSRYYALAFLRSTTGQHLLRGDLSGSVVDHITLEQISAIQIPIVRGIKERVAELTRHSTMLRSSAREVLHGSIERLNALYPNAPARPPRDGWTVRAANLAQRIDAAFHAAHVASLRATLLADGGLRLGDVARCSRPGGRYKTYYVEPPFGTPLLSGRQVLQLEVVGAKCISERSVRAGTGYELRAGWIVFQADGRAEEKLGYPAMVTRDRDGWFASGHVGRVVPNDPKDAGWLWAALASDIVQEQIAALSCGSVVDALYPDDIQDVVLPRRDHVDSQRVVSAWEDLATSAMEAEQAAREVEDALEP